MSHNATQETILRVIRIKVLFATLQEIKHIV